MPHLIISIISPGFSDPIVSWTATDPRRDQVQTSNLGTNIYHRDTLSTCGPRRLYRQIRLQARRRHEGAR